jgi:hypothetical protein
VARSDGAPATTAPKRYNFAHVVGALFALGLGALLTSRLSPFMSTLVALLLVACTAALLVKTRIAGLLRSVPILIAIGAMFGTAMSFSEAAARAQEQRRKQAELEATESRRQVAIARLPALLQKVKDSAAAQDWETGAAAYREAESIDPKSVEPLAAEWAKIEPAVAIIERQRVEEARKKSEEERVKRVEAAVVEADRVASDKTACNTPSPVANAWKALQVAKPEDKLYGRARTAAGRLEKCRKQMLRDLESATRQVMIVQRKAMKEAVDKFFLDNNLDVKVSVGGTNADSMTLTHVFFDSRVWMNKIEEAGLFRQLQTVGFKKVYFRTGFDGGFNYTLNPQPETNLPAPPAMVQMGLGEPLRL